MAINHNCDPCSRRKLPRWYETTTLGQLTGIKSEDFTGRTLLRILRYLQEDATIPIQRELYQWVKKILGYETIKIFYDLTSSYFEGSSDFCALIEFGYSRDHRRDKRQVVIGWAVDQEGIPITHYLFHGNTADLETLDVATDRLRDDFGTVESGRLKDKNKIAERVGAMLKKYKVKRYFKPNYDEGFSFSKRDKVIEEEELYDGMYVLSTTKMDLPAEDVIRIYKERDLVEKAIKVLKSFIDLRPFYGYTEETIRGHVFICYLAYLIRSIMSYYIRDAKLKMSVEDALEQLNRIKVVSVSFSRDKAEVIRKKTSLVSGKQMQIIETLNLKSF